jgi:hypothetical protein
LFSSLIVQIQKAIEGFFDLVFDSSPYVELQWLSMGQARVERRMDFRKRLGMYNYCVLQDLMTVWTPGDAPAEKH